MAAAKKPVGLNYTVTRSFKGMDGRVYQPGDVVDASAWPYGRAHKMVEQRYLMPTIAEMPASAALHAAAQGGD